MQTLFIGQSVLRPALFRNTLPVHCRRIFQQEAFSTPNAFTDRWETTPGILSSILADTSKGTVSTGFSSTCFRLALTPGASSRQ